jgi:hypothetical protein
MAQLFDRGVNFALFDLTVFVVLIASAQPLPREFTLKKIKDHITSPFEIVPSTLLYAKMSVNRCVSSSTSQIFILLVWDVLMCLRISVLLAQPEIDEMRYM